MKMLDGGVVVELGVGEPSAEDDDSSLGVGGKTGDRNEKSEDVSELEESKESAEVEGEMVRVAIILLDWPAVMRGPVRTASRQMSHESRGSVCEKWGLVQRTDGLGEHSSSSSKSRKDERPMQAVAWHAMMPTSTRSKLTGSTS